MPKLKKVDLGNYFVAVWHIPSTEITHFAHISSIMNDILNNITESQVLQEGDYVLNDIELPDGSSLLKHISNGNGVESFGQKEANSESESLCRQGTLLNAVAAGDSCCSSIYSATLIQYFCFLFFSICEFHYFLSFFSLARWPFIISSSCINRYLHNLAWHRKVFEIQVKFIF